MDWLKMHDFLSTPLPSRRQLLAAFFLYLFILVLAFVPKWLAGHSFLTEVIWDPTPVYFQYPGDARAISSLAAGQLPIWDPARGLGTPLVMPVAHSFTQVFKVFAYLIHAPWGWEAYLFLHLLVAGFSTFLLARALPLRPLPAFFAGAAYMLCGYFRIFLNFQHLNLEALYPLMLWSFLLLARKPTLLRTIFSLGIMHQIGAGGNPTITVYGNLLCLAAFAWIAVEKARGASEPRLQARRFFRWFFLFLLTLAGAYIWTGYVLVLFEFMGQAWNLRLPEISLLHVPWSNLIALATPLFDFWLSPAPAAQETRLALLNFIPGYLGITICALALLAILHPSRLPRAGLFFILVLPFPLGVVFGIPPFQLLSYFPILSTSQNFRYIQSFLALTAALAAGMGLELVLSPQASRPRRAALAILAVLLGWCAWHAARFRTEILASPLLPRFLLGLALACVAVGAVLLAARFLLKVKSRELPALGLAAAGIAELLLYFHLATPLYGRQAYAMTQPPAAAWLLAQPGRFRLFGAQPEALHPNLAELNGLEDVRDSTPIYTRRYLQFISALDGLQTPDAILDHYFEQGRFYLDLDLNQVSPRILDLLNVRYVLSRTAFDRRPLPLDDETVRGLAPGRHWVVRIEAMIAGVHRPALFTHAPSRADLPLPSTAGAALVGDAGVLPEALQNPDMDGVFMTAAARTGAGSTLVFSRFLNPRRQAGEREWIPLEASLPPGAAALSLSALPGPRDNRWNDFAVWGEPGLRPADTAPTAQPNLALVYDRDLRIYENPTARPRAFWLPAAQWLASDEEVLRRLLAKEFDPGETALIHARPPGPELNAPAGPAEVKLDDHEWGRAKVRVSAQGAGFLVLSDLYYPGWEARVDGKEARIFPVDLALRGLPLPAGEHEVLFRYRPPSFRVAMWVTLIGYGFALVMLVFRKSFSPAGC